MKLIVEHSNSVELLKENDKESKEQQYYITGVFMQADKQNRNNRVYPLDIVKREVEAYNTKFVSQNRALGELGHPDTPTVNLDRVAHLIKELQLDGSNVVGKAKLLDTPCGKIAKNLVNEGIKLGVSSRGLGSLKERDGVQEVQSDFILNAIDLVADPSAPEAFVEGVLENKEWIYENGVIRPKEIEAIKKEIKNIKKVSDEKLARIFKDFLKKL